MAKTRTTWSFQQFCHFLNGINFVKIESEPSAIHLLEKGVLLFIKILPCILKLSEFEKLE